MDPLAGTKTDGMGYVSGDDESGSSDGQPVTGVKKVPLLNINFSTMALHGGEEVIPYFTPRGSYQTPRSELLADTLFKELAEKKQYCEFSGKTFTHSSAMAFSKYLSDSGCKIKSLKLVNCGLSEDVFPIICAGLARNSSITSFHIEGCPCRMDMCSAIGKVLMSANTTLQSLNLVNVTISVESLSEIVDGVLFQNGLDYGISTLCLEGCRLNDTHADQLKRLIAGSRKLQSLMLQGNQLGSAVVMRPRRVTPPKLALATGQPATEDSGASKAILAICSGLANNTTIQNVILASNKISVADHSELSEVLKDNDKVRVNLTGNSLELPMKDVRLITQGKSPRSMACPMQSAVTPRVQHTPRGSKLADGEKKAKIVLKKQFE